MSRNTHLPILPTPGMTDPRFTRLRFMTADAGAAGTAGATDTSGADAANAADSGAAAGADAGSTTDTGSQADQAGAADASDSPWSNEDTAKAEIEKLRRENAAARTKAKADAAQEARDAVVQEFGKALGFIKDGDDTPDPAALATAAQEATETARTAQVELAVYKAAGPLGADPDELLERRSIVAGLTKLDPTADDFPDQVKALIKKAVTDNPKLLAQAQAAGASSPDHAGGSGEASTDDDSVEAFRKKRAAWRS